MTAVVPKGDHEVAPARPAPTGSGRKGSLAWKSEKSVPPERLSARTSRVDDHCPRYGYCAP